MKVLIIKIWALGEVVLTTEAVRIIKEKTDVDTITYLTGKSAKPLLINNPYIDEIITVDEEIFLKPQPSHIINLIHNIRKREFDLCLILHHDKNFITFAKLLGVKRVLGIDRNGDGERLDMSVPMNPDIHQAEEYSFVAELPGVKDDGDGLELYNDRESLDIDGEKILENNYILLAPGGGINPKTYMPQKRTPLKILIPLIDYLRELEYHTFTIGTKRESKMGDYIHIISEGDIRSLIGKTSLSELVSLISRTRLLITNDSLPLHISSAYKKPTIAIFGPTSPVRYGPYKNDKSVIVKPDIKCAPCYRDGVIKSCATMNCWNEINTYDIIKGIEILGVL